MQLVILVVSLIFRLLYSGTVPVSLSHDEIDTVIQAHSFVQTGSDIVGTWSPFTLLPNSGVMGEWVPMINSLAATLLPVNLMTSRLTTIILSALYPLLIIWLLMSIGAKRGVANWAGLLLAISPWHILFSRTALEQPFSLFFYTLSWIFLVKYMQKVSLRNGVAFALSYVVGFLTYHGYKFSLPIVTTVIAVWSLKDPSKNWRRLLLPVVVIAALLAHIVINADAYSSRSGELIFSDLSTIAGEVDNEHRLSLAPSPIKSILSNKAVSLTLLMTEKYLGAYSPSLLFFHGEENGVFSVWKTGYLSLYMLPLLVIGGATIVILRQRWHLLILTLLLLAPLSTVIHENNSYAFRSAFFFVALHMVAAVGAERLFAWSARKNITKIVAPIFGALVVFNCAYFGYIYYYLTPVTNAKAYFFSDRVLANYLMHVQDKKVLVIDPQPRYVFAQYVMADGRVTRDEIEGFKGQYDPSDLNTYVYQNLVITQNCPEEVGNFDTAIVSYLAYDALATCPAVKQVRSVNGSQVSIVYPADNSRDRYIVGDTLCQGDLSRYIRPTTPKDFALESMPSQVLCQKWLLR